MTGNGATWNFTYDADGMRARRTGAGKDYSYTYSGGSLVHLDANGDILSFTYDTAGSPQTVTYNGTQYYYVTNLQGDVIGIVNGSGTSVVTYTYDAWGNPISTSGTMASTLGTLNPLRYRGYVYDTETGLYYLQSRYYNPATGRFINADNYPSTGQGLTGNNMFTYCGNNPVSRADQGGIFWHILIGAAIGAIANGVITVVSNLLDDDPETEWYDGVGVAMATGAITGGVAVTGCGPAVQMVVNAAATAIEGLPDVVEDIKNGEDVLTTLGSYALDVGISAVTSYGPGISSKAATNLGKQTIKRTVKAFVHDGFRAGVTEIGKAAKWYWKSSKKIIGRNIWEQTKGSLNDLADTVFRELIF